MRNIMCTNCGCKTLIRADLPFGVSGDVFMTAHRTLEIYACLECGHLEFFDSYSVDEYNESIKRVESILNKLQILRKQLSDLENSMDLFNDEIKQLEHQSKSLDITIRQQQELQARIRELQTKVRTIPNDIANLSRTIKNLEEKLERAKEKLSNWEKQIIK